MTSFSLVTKTRQVFPAQWFKPAGVLHHSDPGIALKQPEALGSRQRAAMVLVFKGIAPAAWPCHTLRMVWMLPALDSLLLNPLWHRLLPRTSASFGPCPEIAAFEMEQ